MTLFHFFCCNRKGNGFGTIGLESDYIVQTIGTAYTCGCPFLSFLIGKFCFVCSLEQVESRESFSFGGDEESVAFLEGLAVRGKCGETCSLMI